MSSIIMLCVCSFSLHLRSQVCEHGDVSRATVMFTSIFHRWLIDAMTDSDSDATLTKCPGNMESAVVLPMDESFRLSESQVVFHGEAFRQEEAAGIVGPFLIYLPIETRRVVYVSVDVVVDQHDGSDIESEARAP